jgi:hypothetical protein
MVVVGVMILEPVKGIAAGAVAIPVCGAFMVEIAGLTLY